MRPDTLSSTQKALFRAQKQASPNQPTTNPTGCLEPELLWLPNCQLHQPLPSSGHLAEDEVRYARQGSYRLKIHGSYNNRIYNPSCPQPSNGVHLSPPLGGLFLTVIISMIYRIPPRLVYLYALSKFYASAILSRPACLAWYNASSAASKSSVPVKPSSGYAATPPDTVI